MKKILIISLLLLIFAKKAVAADYQVACDNNGCTGPTTAVFNETNIAPADSITKSIQVKNNYHETLNLSMTTAKDSGTDDIFLDAVDVIVTGLGGRTRFNNSLRQFLNNPAIDLGSLNDSGRGQIKISLTFQKADNPYQTKQAEFDLPIQINVQAQAYDQGTGSASQPLPTSSFSKSLPPAVGFLSSFLGQVAGQSSRSAEISPPRNQQSLQLSNQFKTYFRLWPWLLLLIPIIWRIFLLYKR